jgi:hypothetical protein
MIPDPRSGSAEPELDFEEPLFEHGHAARQRGVEIGLVGFDLAQTDGLGFRERGEAAEELGLHVAHFLDQPIFHASQVMLEKLDVLLDNVDVLLDNVDVLLDNVDVLLDKVNVLLEKVDILLGGRAVVVGHEKQVPFVRLRWLRRSL